MKSFKTLLSEVAEPKSAEEQRFKDQHTYEVIKHPVALDSQFTGEITPGQNTKDKGKRAADQKGDAAYDKAYSKHGDGSTKLVAKESVDLDEGILGKVRNKLMGPAIKHHLKTEIQHHKNQSSAHRIEGGHIKLIALSGRNGAKLNPKDKTKIDYHNLLSDHHIKAENHLRAALKHHNDKNYADRDDHMNQYNDHTKNAKIGKKSIPYKTIRNFDESVDLDESGMTDAQKMTFDKLYKKMNNGPEHKALKQKHGNMVKADDAFHALVKQKAMTEAKELTDEELSAKQKKIDLNKNGKVDGHDLAMLRAKKHKTEGKKAFKDLRGEGLMSALKKPVTQTGPDGRTRTVMKTTRNINKDDRGYDKIRTNESDELLDEGMKFKKGNLKLKDRSQVMVTKEDADKLNKLMGGLDRNNLKRMEATAVKDKKSFNEILSFAREAT